MAKHPKTCSAFVVHSAVLWTDAFLAREAGPRRRPRVTGHGPGAVNDLQPRVAVSRSSPYAERRSTASQGNRAHLATAQAADAENDAMDDSQNRATRAGDTMSKQGNERSVASSVGPRLNAEFQTAIERDGIDDRFVDLRSLTRVGWGYVKMAGSPAEGCSFGPFDEASAVEAIPDSVLFGPDTIALSESHRAVIRALLSRRSVFYSTAVPERDKLILDIALRVNEWNQTIVYCAPTVRAAESMYATLVAHLSAKSCVILDLGHESVSSSKNTMPKSGVVITVPSLLRRGLLQESTYWWTKSDLYIMDNLLIPGIVEWEEIILATPRRALVCIISNELPRFELDELPLWLDAVQNSTIQIVPRAARGFEDRIDRPDEAPSIRVYVYNAATHEYPIQVSLPRLKEEVQREIRDSLDNARVSNQFASPLSGGPQQSANTTDYTDWIQYDRALLHGVQSIAAYDVQEFAFEDRSFAQYADVAALVLEDTIETSAKVKGKPGRKRTASQPKGGRKSSSTSGLSAAVLLRRRRRADSALLPATVLIHGQTEADCAAGAICWALVENKVGLIIDPGAEELLQNLMDEFCVEHEKDLTKDDVKYLGYLQHGIGVSHDGVSPPLRTLAEQLYRDGVVPVLVVDTYVGPHDIAALPRGRSVLVQASALAEETDSKKGLLKGSCVTSIAGRPGIDDVGNFVALWYDEHVDDSEAACELASALFMADAVSADEHARLYLSSKAPLSAPVDVLLDPRHKTTMCYQPDATSSVRRASTTFLTTYDGMMGTMVRHGATGYETVEDLTLSAYRGFLIRSALTATREKLEVEMSAVDKQLEGVDWDDMAAHDRLEAKYSEQLRMLEAMVARRDVVMREMMLEELRASSPGTIVGLRIKGGDSTTKPDNRALAGSTTASASQRAAGPEGKSPELQRVHKSTVAVADEQARSPESTSSASDGSKTVGSFAKGPLEAVPSKKPLSPAVLAALYDNSSGQAPPSPVKSRALVVCITVDNMWTLVPIEDVAAVSSSEEIVPNVDLIPIPHLGTFDLDADVGWARCKACSESETARLSAVSDYLTTAMLDKSSLIATLKERELSEISKQRQRVAAAQRVLSQSAWLDRQDEMAELRRLRRITHRIRDDVNALVKSENKVIEAIEKNRSGLSSRVNAILETLAASNAIVRSEDSGGVEATPVGLGMIALPGAYPMFTSAVLMLSSDLEFLTGAELAALVALLVLATPPLYVNEDDVDEAQRGVRNGINKAAGSSVLAMAARDLDAGRTSRSGRPGITGEDREVDDLEAVLPARVLSEVDEIRKALRNVQHKHFSTPTLSKLKPRIAPHRLDTRWARIVFDFVDGAASWKTVVATSGLPVGEVTLAFRTVREALLCMQKPEFALGELEAIQATIAKAADRLDVWPITSGDELNALSKRGVGAKLITWNSRAGTYRAWWNRVKPEVEAAVASARASVPIADAEVVPAGVDDALTPENEAEEVVE